MKFSCLIGCRFLFALLALGLLGHPLAAQSANKAEATDDTATDDTAAEHTAAADRFVVPTGSPADLLAYITDLATTEPQLKSQDEYRAYFEKVAAAISSAADQILAAEAIDKQTVDAIEWKIESLRLRGQLGDRQADAKINEFLNQWADDSRPAVADAIRKLQGFRKEMEFVKAWQGKLRRLGGLDPAGRAEIVEELVSEIQAADVFANQLVLMVQVCDFMADTDDPAPAIRALGVLMPKFRASDDPQVAKRLPMLEGIERRLNLPGNKLELAGTLLDGTEFDWESYRGRVVLVDFWASWCGPCLAELPTVKDNFDRYHEKGFDVIGISLDDDRSETERVMRDADIPWATLFHVGSDESGWQHPMALKYGVTGIPRAILVDAEGNVVHMNARGPRLGAELARLLGEPPADTSSAVDNADDKKTALNEAR